MKTIQANKFKLYKGRDLQKVMVLWVTRCTISMQEQAKYDENIAIA